MTDRRRRGARQRSASDLVGQEYTVTCGAVAHGGFVVARHEGQVIFVRHGLPGEVVTIRVTEGGRTDRFLRADVVAVHDASPQRRAPRCRWSGPGGCGGCDWQHTSTGYARTLKADVVREQLQRLAGITWEGEVEGLPGDADGLHWRTRMQFAVGAEGRAGLRGHRSHQVIAVRDCPIADRRILDSDVLGTTWSGVSSVTVVAADAPQDAVVLPRPGGRSPYVGQVVSVPDGDLEYTLSADGFWQTHPGAAAAYVEHLLDCLDPQPGERVVDLYAGAGLFTLPFALAVGHTGAVLAVEGNDRALEDGGANTEGLSQVEWRAGDVARVLEPVVDSGARTDLVVLDPPRTGAGKVVVEQMVALEPRSVGYVACDPAALARDLGLFAERGYRLSSLRAFDAFPLTHHVECIAVLVRAQ